MNHENDPEGTRAARVMAKDLAELASTFAQRAEDALEAKQ